MKSRAWITAIILFSCHSHAWSICAESTPSIEVVTDQHRLFLCENGQVHRAYAVALGRGGIGKRKQGDGKTPLGVYRLGTPRGSKGFHRFVSIEYPTPEQKKAGFTGQDVGIHGPARAFRWAGRLNTWISWTNGCVAVSSDNDMDAIADWIRQTKPKTITIR